jgi:hypothetical protein
LRTNRFGKRHPLHDQRVAVRQALIVVVNPRVVEAPHDVAVPIEFEARRSLAVQPALAGYVVSRLRQRHQVAVGKQFGIHDAERALPAVHEPTLHVHEPRFVDIRREQRIAVIAQLRVVVDESVRVMLGPGHQRFAAAQPVA